MQRRAFVAALVGTVVAVPRAAEAQQRSYRIGYLSAGSLGLAISPSVLLRADEVIQ